MTCVGRSKTSNGNDVISYRVCEPEIPSGIALKNKRRKRARDQNLNVCSLPGALLTL